MNGSDGMIWYSLFVGMVSALFIGAGIGLASWTTDLKALVCALIGVTLIGPAIVLLTGEPRAPDRWKQIRSQADTIPAGRVVEVVDGGRRYVCQFAPLVAAPPAPVPPAPAMTPR